MKPSRHLRIVLSLLPLSFLGACSSGSGGGGSSVSLEPVAITTDNAMEVAAGVPMTSSLMSFQEFMGFQTLTADGTGTFDCPDGGSITAGFDVDAAPLGEVSSGDRFSVRFDNCRLDESFRIDGRIGIDFDTIVGDWEVDDTWEVDLGFEIDDLTFSGEGATGYFDGNWSQSASMDMGDAEYSLAGEFTTSLNAGEGYETATLNGLALSWSYDELAGEATYSVDGVFASTELGGSVRLTTLAPFVLADANEYPHTGTVQATGAGGSRLTFTVLDETSVQLDVDEDGDGTAELTLTLSWFELEE